MCEPTTIMAVSLAITTAQAALQYQQQQKQADQQQKAVEYGNELQTAALGRQYDEQNAVAQEQLGSRAQQHLQDLGRLHALAADTGAMGASTDRVMADERNTAAKDIVTIQENSRRSGEQSHAGGMSKQAETNTMLSNIRRPSALGTGLQIGSAAVSAYGSYQTRQAAIEAANKK